MGYYCTESAPYLGPNLALIVPAPPAKVVSWDLFNNELDKGRAHQLGSVGIRWVEVGRGKGRVRVKVRVLSWSRVI